MVRASIEEPGFISLDGNTYRAKGPVRSQLAPQFAQKQVTGDVNMESHLDVSYIRWDDWTEWIGLEEFFSSGGLAPKRAWFSTCDMFTPQHLTLGPLVTVTTDPSEGTTINTNDDNQPRLATFKNEIYQISTTVSEVEIFKYSNSGDSWASQYQFTGGSNGGPFFIVTGFVNHVHNIVAGHGDAGQGDSRYAHSTDGSSWTQVTKEVAHMVIWDNRLWGLDRDGKFWYSTTLGEHINLSPLDVDPAESTLSSGSGVNALYMAHLTNNEEAIHANTSAGGVYTYDIENDRWGLRLQLPQAPYAGLGHAEWNGDLYISNGMNVYQILATSETTQVVRNIRITKDDGVPEANRAANQALAATGVYLAFVGSAGLTGFQAYGTTPWDGTLYVWDGNGWHVLDVFLTSAGSGVVKRLQHVHFSSAYSIERLWWSEYTSGTKPSVRYVAVPTELANPNYSTGRTYAASSTHDTPHFRVGNDVTGIALSVQVEVEGASANETVTLSYDINRTGSFTAFAAITSDGITEFPFPNATAPSGTEFRSIQFRVALVRGGTTTNTPDARSITFKFDKKLEERWTHFVTLDISEEIGTQSPRAQWEALRTSINKNSLLEFTMKDDDTAASTRRHWVRVRGRDGDEETGLEYRGEARLVLQEPQHLQA